MENGDSMEFKDYMKEVMEKVNDEGGACRVKMGDDEFMLHDECFCDFQDDFVIMYDTKTEVSIVTRYNAIETLQYCPKERLDEIQSKALDEIKSDLFKALLGD